MLHTKNSLHKLEIVLKCYIEKYARNKNFSLVLKTKYCKSYYGTYRGDLKRVTLYVTTIEGNFYPLSRLLLTLFHEISHHDEYQDKDFKRVKGVMHSPRFYEIFNSYKELINFESLGRKN